MTNHLPAKSLTFWRRALLALALMAFSGASPAGALTATPSAQPLLQATPSATASPSASASLPIDEGPRFRAAEIQVRGNKTISEETILLTIPIHAGQEISKAQVMESMQRIYGLGYFMDVRAATEPVHGGERLIFNVIENPALKDVRLQGVTVFPESELKKPFSSMIGRVINLKDVQGAVKEIEKRYLDQGYVLARVIDLQVQPAGELDLKFAEGIINEIKVTGNEDTQDYVIRREITLKHGQLYNFKRMEEDLRRVYNLNYFEDINIKYEPAPDDASKVNVIIAVKEKQTGSFQLSAGWSNRDGPLGMLSLKKDNIFGRGQSVSADLTISKNWAAELNYFNPWVDEEHTSFGSSVYARRYYNYYAQVLEERQGLALSFGRPLFGQDPVTAQWRGAARIRTERVNLKGVNAAGDDYTEPVDTGSGKAVAPGAGSGRTADLSTTLGYTVTFDSRDYLLSPNTGWFNTYSLDQYVPGLGDLSMTRLQLDVNRYVPLWFGHTLAMGWKLGTLQTLLGGGVPAYERFYSTGAYLIRGWSESPSSSYMTNLGTLGTTFSGDSFTLGSLEYRFPIVNILSGVLFADSGIFWDQSKKNFSLDRTRSGYGAGIRVNTPLGPLRLDLGLQKWFDYQIHFSIGQKF